MARPTEQDSFWEGEFGDGYTRRNQDLNQVASNAALFTRVLDRTRGLASVLELGANIGLNLMAIRQLLPEARLSAVEINASAAERLQAGIPGADVHRTSILDFTPDRSWDLVFTKGVLIHIHPDQLPGVYDLLYRSSARYILICEYYHPTPAKMDYRGYKNRLFKRDFAGEMLDRFPGLTLSDYGFLYHRDNNFYQDDMTWFLMEKP